MNSGPLLQRLENSSVINYGTGRPVNATVSGDPNQDGNDLNDRLPGYRRNAFIGPDYATTDLRLTRTIRFQSATNSTWSPNRSIS